MKPISKLLLFFLTAATAPALFAAQVPGATPAVDALFSTVPMGDPTYSRLSQLEKSGLLPAGASAAPLTRYEVAKDILTAQSRYDKIVVAQADTDMLPSVEDLNSAGTTTATGTDSSAATAATAAPEAGAPVTESDEDLSKAAQTLTSLQDAYQY